MTAHQTKPPVPPRSLAIVLPCRNEEANVERVVTDVIAAAQPLCPRLEIIIVDDGSTDRTPERAQALTAADPRVRLVRNHPGRGYGGALQAGFAQTRADWVFYTDGDGQFDPSQLHALLPLLEQADIVAGYRINRAEGLTRRFNAFAWTALVRAVFGLRVRDVDCAFKVFPGWFVRETPLVSNGALISAELLARATRAKLRIHQVGVRHRARSAGHPTGAKLAVILKAFRELFSLAGRIRSGK
ncbi:Dodecaprenyl-phosphate galacturonate synthase [Phycisphaerales bacterium]|nr:Dodecaprenyl-phosphate galacturonate synthase [Phycisphaerales bacterium]